MKQVQKILVVKCFLSDSILDNLKQMASSSMFFNNWTDKMGFASWDFYSDLWTSQSWILSYLCKICFHIKFMLKIYLLIYKKNSTKDNDDFFFF